MGNQGAISVTRPSMYLAVIGLLTLYLSYILEGGPLTSFIFVLETDKFPYGWVVILWQPGNAIFIPFKRRLITNILPSDLCEVEAVKFIYSYRCLS